MNKKELEQEITELLNNSSCLEYNEYIYVLSVNTEVQHIKPLLHKMLLAEKRKIQFICLLSGTFTNDEWKIVFEASKFIWGSKKDKLTQICDSIDHRYPRLEKKHGINRELFRSKIMNLSRVKWNALDWLFSYYNNNVPSKYNALWFANLNSLSSTRKNKVKILNELSEKNA